MLRWEISPDFKAYRRTSPGTPRRAVRTVQTCVRRPEDRLNRFAVIASLPVTLFAIVVFSVGGAQGPQIVDGMKQRAYQTIAQLRTNDPFLRRTAIDYTPTGSIAGQKAAAPQTRIAPLAKPLMRIGR